MIPVGVLGWEDKLKPVSKYKNMSSIILRQNAEKKYNP